jgi:hypothetical protein
MAEKSRPRGKWNDPAVPHKGWTCMDIEDLEEPVGICEMCENQEVRYVHIMEHPDYPETIRARCDCAGAMEEDSKRACKREQTLKNSATRRGYWLQRTWRTSAKGNSYLNTDGFNIVIFKHSRGWTYRITDREADKSWIASQSYESEDCGLRQANFSQVVALVTSRSKDCNFSLGQYPELYRLAKELTLQKGLGTGG